MESTAPIPIDYRFEFGDDEVITVGVQLDPTTLDLLYEPSGELPAWTSMASHRCSVCRLDAETHDHCPVAVNFVDLIERFPHRHSYEEVALAVELPERTVSGRTTLQHALSSLAGIYMVTAGCPALDKLRAMVRFHQPLATLQETLFRAMSMYLLAQFMRYRNGLLPDWSMAGLEALYQEVHRINLEFGERLRNVPVHDANTNALVRLDLFTYGFTVNFEDSLDELETFFSAYLRDF